MIRDFRNKFYTKLLNEYTDNNKNFKSTYAKIIKDLRQNRILNEYLSISDYINNTTMLNRDEAYSYISDTLLFLKENKNELKNKIKEFSKKHLSDVKETKYDNNIDCLIETILGEFNAKTHKKINEAKTKLVEHLLCEKRSDDFYEISGEDGQIVLALALKDLKENHYSKLNDSDKEFIKLFLEHEKNNKLFELNKSMINEINALIEKELSNINNLIEEEVNILNEVKNKISLIEESKINSSELCYELFELKCNLMEE